MTTFNFIKKNFSYLVIAALVIVIIFMRSCSGTSNGGKEIIKVDGKKYEVIKRETDTIRVPVIQTVYKPGNDIIHEVINYVNIPANVDSMAVVKDYFATRVYKDTLKLEGDLGYITVTDSITKNALAGRLWNSNVNKTTINNTIYLKELPRTQLYIGGTLGMQRPEALTIGGNLILKDKKDRMYGIGYGVNSNLNSYFQASMLWKISLKK